MSGETKTLDVMIMGKSYRVSCSPDEEKDLQAICKTHDLSLIFLIAPTTPLPRAKKIADASTDFIYYVSLRGVTGARAAVSSDLHVHLQQVRKQTTKPVLVGFGVSTAAQAKQIARNTPTSQEDT